MSDLVFLFSQPSTIKYNSQVLLGSAYFHRLLYILQLAANLQAKLREAKNPKVIFFKRY